ncbi:MAG: FliI/YscN family ATPase [Thermoguttaceae bacterium]|nr:FliI/YscN family ATPase [Thermoguttaceae bacterium]
MNNIQSYINQLNEINPMALTGTVVQTIGQTVVAEGFPVPVGAVAEICRPGMKPIYAQTIGFRDNQTLLSPYDSLTGVRSGSAIRLFRSEPKLKIGDELLGRIVDAFGEPVDDGAPALLPQRVSFVNPAPQAHKRPRIDQIFSTGVRAIDALLTCGRGQRLGIFAGSGVGKSTLLGMMARYSKADVIVLGLVGERGRELNEFIDSNLGAEGLAKSVIVVSTSDEPAIKRELSCYTATAIAEYFRDQGKDVLLLMDSLTRFAQAKREVGLAAGEPAAARGYPPSVFAAMAPLLERAGRTEKGSITAFYTVLVEGDDENEPVADAVRGLLDGHIWLSRKIAQAGRFPAIDILKSVSRLANDLTDSKLRRAARSFRQALAAYKDCEDLISIGAYKHGSNPMVDDAIRLRPAMLDFLQQNVDDPDDFHSAKERLERILGE